MNNRNVTTRTLVLLLAGALPAARAGAAGAEIRLWAQAVVTEPTIRLGHIAAITGDESLLPALNNLALSGPVLDGSTTSLRAARVVAALGDAGFDVSQIRLTGAAACSVRCQLTSAGNASDGASKPGLTLTQAARQAPPASLEAALRTLIARNLDGGILPPEHEVRIAFNPTLQSLLALTDPPYRFDIQAQRNNAGLGLLAFKVKVYRDGELLQTVPVMADVTVRAQVLVTTRKINAKVRLTRQDVEKTWRPITRLGESLLTDLNDVLDHQAKRMIPSGTALTGPCLESLPLVKRGQIVNVVYSAGGLDIKTVGTAMQTGYRNDTVQVRNERSKELFRARITGPGQVSVQKDSAGPSVDAAEPAVGSVP